MRRATTMPRPSATGPGEPAPGTRAAAMGAAIGAAAGAVAVAGLDAAVDIMAALKRDGAGRADLVIAAGQPWSGRPSANGSDGRDGDPGVPADRPAAGMPPRILPDGTGGGAGDGAGRAVIRALDLVMAPGELAPAVEQLLDGGQIGRASCRERAEISGGAG